MRTAPAAVLRFDADRALRWLAGPEVVDRRGGVCSWVNPVHPGHRYPEAAGLLLSVLSQTGAHAEVATRVAAALHADVEADAVGRDGLRYLFDEGIAIAGLVRHARATGAAPSVALQTAHARFRDRLGRGEATGEPRPAPRWSTRPGPHLLKAAITIGAWPDVPAADRTRLAQLVDHAAARCHAGRFATQPEGDATYLHAHCYALEGLLRLTAPDLVPSPLRAGAGRLAAAGAAWLATVQRPDGGLPAFHDGARGWGPCPSDVAAQAIRIWCCIDDARFETQIRRARSFLDSLTVDGGALRYHAHSDDLNVWATVFAVQAERFATGTADPRQLA